MRPLLPGLATVLAALVVATPASAARPLSPGLHDATARASITERPGALFAGTLNARELFDVIRVSPTGTFAQGHPWGDRARTLWVATSALSTKSPQAPRGMTEVPGPAGTRVFAPAADLGCRGTNFLTVGVRLRGARSGRVSILRAGKVVARSRTLRGRFLQADQVRVPCNGASIVRYTVDGRHKDFRVKVDDGSVPPA